HLSCICAGGNARPIDSADGGRGCGARSHGEFGGWPAGAADGGFDGAGVDDVDGSSAARSASRWEEAGLRTDAALVSLCAGLGFGTGDDDAVGVDCASTDFVGRTRRSIAGLW